MELEKVINPRVTFARNIEPEPDNLRVASDALIAFGTLIVFLDNLNRQPNNLTLNLFALVPIAYGIFLGLLPGENIS